MKNQMKLSEQLIEQAEWWTPGFYDHDLYSIPASMHIHEIYTRDYRNFTNSNGLVISSMYLCLFEAEIQKDEEWEKATKNNEWLTDTDNKRSVSY